MVEMQMETARLMRLRMQQLGEDWINAVMNQALERLEGLCLPQVDSHLMTPKQYTHLEQVADLVAKFRQWFGTSNHFRLEHSRVEAVGERLAIFYRFLFQEHGSWFVVEQQLYCSLQDGRVSRLHLLCSGFQPVEVSAANMPAASLPAARKPAATIPALANMPADPAGDALLVLHTGAAGAESTCAVLTPAIKAKLRDLHSGQVLEVRVDDPSAREDIEVWCRLSGNQLLKITADDGPELRFLVKKK